MCAGVRELISWDKSENAAEFLQIIRKGLISSIEKLFPDDSVADVGFHRGNVDLNPTENWVYMEGKFFNAVKFWKGVKLEWENLQTLECWRFSGSATKDQFP